MSQGLLLLLIVTMAYADQSGQLCFNATDKGLPWPLTDPNNIEIAIVHGVHCLDLLKSFLTDPPKNHIDISHKAHCVSFLKKVTKDLQEQPGKYIVSPIACKYLLAEMESIHKPGGRFGLMFMIWQRYWPSTLKISIESSASQDEKLYKIGAKNFGEEVINIFEHKERLTKEEKIFADTLESDKVITLGGLGIVCSHQSNVKNAMVDIEKFI